MAIRLDKFLTEVGIGTRSEVKKYIRQGLVTIDSVPAQKPEQKIDEKTAKLYRQRARNEAVETMTNIAYLKDK